MLTVAGAVAAMRLRNLVHSVLALTLAFAGLAAVYLQLGAQFVGFAQILVYVGAVAILVVFAVLLTRDTEASSQPIVLAPSWVGSGVVVSPFLGFWRGRFFTALLLDALRCRSLKLRCSRSATH